MLISALCNANSDSTSMVMISRCKVDNDGILEEWMIDIDRQGRWGKTANPLFLGEEMWYYLPSDSLSSQTLV